jgi:hypothetical protein
VGYLYLTGANQYRAVLAMKGGVIKSAIKFPTRYIQ